MQGVRGAQDVVGVHHERVLAQFRVRPRLPRQDQYAALVGDDRHLLGDQVHPVPDRVDQGHVGEPVRGQGPREVVLDVQHDRGPPRRPVLGVDLVRQPLHLGGVVPVDGEVLPGGVGEGHVHDPLAPLGAVVEELPVRQQSAHDVLRQLGPVDPDDRLSGGPGGPGPDFRPQPGDPLLDVRLVRAGAQELGVGPEAVHTDLGVPEPARQLGAADGEGVRPAPGEEAEPVGAEHALQHLARHLVGQHAEVVHRGPRGVREVADPQVGAELAEQSRHQRQVVVLHQDRRTLGRLVGQRLGEGPVVAGVVLPLPPEIGVEHRF